MEMLEAVNTVLPYLGEHVVTAVEGSKHPTVSLIQKAIDRHTDTLLSKGWWFNELNLTLNPDSQGFIDTPTDAIEVYGDGVSVAIDGERLFNLSEGTRYFTRPIKVRVILDRPFDKLPRTAALYVTYQAAIEVYTADLGAEDTLQILNGFANENIVQLREINLRQRKYNNQTVARRHSSYFSRRFR